MALLPGMPILPFLALAGGVGYLACRARQGARPRRCRPRRRGRRPRRPPPPAPRRRSPITDSLKIDELKLELGYGLLPLVKEDDTGTDRLTEQIKALRRQLATELGFVMPPVRILDNMQLEPNDYKVKIKEVEAGHGQIYANQLMVMDPMGKRDHLPGHHTTEPTFGLPATWIEPALRDEAELRGYSIIDPSTVISTHLTEVLKANVADLLSYANVQSLLDGLTKDQQKLVEDIVPGQISVSGIQRVLQTLLTERISIRDLPTILEGIAEVAGAGRTATGSPSTCARASPARSAPPISGPTATCRCSRCRRNGSAISPKPWSATATTATSPWRPRKLQQFIAAVREAFENAAQQGEIPVLITSPGIRPHVRAIIERFRPQTVVMSQNEVHPRVRLKTIGSV